MKTSKATTLITKSTSVELKSVKTSSFPIFRSKSNYLILEKNLQKFNFKNMSSLIK